MARKSSIGVASAGRNSDHDADHYCHQGSRFQRRTVFVCLWTLSMILSLEMSFASQEHNCSEVKCPSITSIQCPEDSYALETNQFTAIKKDEEHQIIIEEVLVNCCVTKMCACRDVCDIPSCHNKSLVLIEEEPGTNIPGKCCSKYGCGFEPNCTEIGNSKGHWLVDCQKCQCLSGQKICHRSCDEMIMPQHPANCISTNLKKMFRNGETWEEDECTHCECHRGKRKCQTSLCRPLNCAQKVKLPGECCQSCTDESIIENYHHFLINNGSSFVGKQHSNGSSENISEATTTEYSTTTPAPITTIVESSTSSSSSSPSSLSPLPSVETETAQSVTRKTIIQPQQNEIQENWKDKSNNGYNKKKEQKSETENNQLPKVSTPCKIGAENSTDPDSPKNTSSTSAIFIHHTEVEVDVVPAIKRNCILYGIIAGLSIILIIFIGLYCHEKSKQRSYRPVSVLDDNFNKITGKIKSKEFAYA